MIFSNALFGLASIIFPYELKEDPKPVELVKSDTPSTSVQRSSSSGRIQLIYPHRHVTFSEIYSDIKGNYHSTLHAMTIVKIHLSPTCQLKNWTGGQEPFKIKINNDNGTMCVWLKDTIQHDIEICDLVKV